VNRPSIFAVFFVSWWCAASVAQPPQATDFRLAPIFGDHMVLPPEASVPVRGFGPVGAEVLVSPSWAKAARAEVTSDGTWRVDIRTAPRGEQHELVVTCGGDKRHIRDILMGDVWLASGQSNMEMQVRGVYDAEQVARDANYPTLRVFHATRQTSDHPADHVEGQWRVCTPEDAGSFSAVAYFFGRDLVEANKGPIGLVVSSWGGTRCEAWTSATGLAAFSEYDEQLAKQMAGGPSSTEQKRRDARAAFFQAAAAAVPKDDPVEVRVPDVWSRSSLGNFDGVVDYRRKIALPANYRGQELVLELGAIDDMDTVFWNSKRVAGSERDGVWSTPRKYVVPAEHTDAEFVDLVVRVVDTGGEGGFTSASDAIKLVCKGADGPHVTPLAGTWSRTVRADLSQLPAWPRKAQGPNRPAVLYNGMIAPLLPFPFTGCIWYQGESNRNRPEQYRTLFPAMIRDWRREMGRAVPFYFVQIAPFGYRGDTGNCARLRAAQAVALDLPHTGMAVTLDCGDARDIHPKAKQPVGARLALLARAQHYGDAVMSSGPRAVGVTRRGEELLVRLAANTGEPLLMHGGAGFEVAGADGEFRAAKARVDSGQLLLSCAEVQQPQTVRYAWRAVPEWSLVNEAGLPGAPFELPVR